MVFFPTTTINTTSKYIFHITFKISPKILFIKGNSNNKVSRHAICQITFELFIHKNFITNGETYISRITTAGYKKMQIESISFSKASLT